MSASEKKVVKFLASPQIKFYHYTTARPSIHIRLKVSGRVASTCHMKITGECRGATTVLKLGDHIDL
jgi:hypothetical protein